MTPRLVKLRRRLGAAVLGFGLVAGATTVIQSVGMESASAHTGDLTVTVSCNTQTGNYDETAKLTLSNVPSGNTGSTKWRVGSSNFEGTPTSASGMDKGPISSHGNTTITLGSWSVPGTTTGYGPWVYAYTQWSPDGNKVGSDGQSLTKLAGDCSKKVYVCKYVGTPGVDERLQTGQNPIEVSVNSIQNNRWGGKVPGWFSDAHDRSYVLGYVPMSPPPTAASCPTPSQPTPKDATASVTVSQPTCDTAGSASLKDVKYATLVGTLDQSVGTHVAQFKATEGHLFANGTDTLQVSYTVAGKDTSTCSPPPVVVHPKNVHGKAVKLDKCQSFNYYKVGHSKGIVYTVNGKTLRDAREGKWLRTHGKRVVVRAHAASSGYHLVGKTKWVFRYANTSSCAPDQVTPPDTGLERLAA